MHDLQIHVTEITEEQRFGFTSKLFGERAFIEGEIAVYQWMRQLCTTYNGGYWRFFGLSDGGYFMQPDVEEPLRLVWPLNWSDEVVSAQAAGIVATMFGLSQVLESYPDELVIDNYHKLREFLGQHPESRAMFRLID
ncbi:MAG TPA: antirestriction protein [Pusillimonas sp.]|nr:antirestriction protein [Pusillimonas sp.]